MGRTVYTSNFSEGRTCTTCDRHFDIDGKGKTAEMRWSVSVPMIYEEDEESWKAIPRAWENGYSANHFSEN